MFSRAPLWLSTGLISRSCFRSILVTITACDGQTRKDRAMHGVARIKTDLIVAGFRSCGLTPNFQDDRQGVVILNRKRTTTREHRFGSELATASWSIQGVLFSTPWSIQRGVGGVYGQCRRGAGLTMATETIRFRRRRRWRDPAM